MKQKPIGSFYLGFAHVDLIAREGDGAEFYICPEAGKPARIKIGMDHKGWDTIVACLLHEAFELKMSTAYQRYAATSKAGTDAGDFLFVMNHSQFSEACAAVSEYMVAALPKLQKVWKSWNKKPKKKRKNPVNKKPTDPCTCGFKEFKTIEPGRKWKCRNPKCGRILELKPK